MNTSTSSTGSTGSTKHSRRSILQSLLYAPIAITTPKLEAHVIETHTGAQAILHPPTIPITHIPAPGYTCEGLVSCIAQDLSRYLSSAVSKAGIEYITPDWGSPWQCHVGDTARFGKNGERTARIQHIEYTLPIEIQEYGKKGEIAGEDFNHQRSNPLIRAGFQALLDHLILNASTPHANGILIGASLPLIVPGIGVFSAIASHPVHTRCMIYFCVSYLRLYITLDVMYGYVVG